MVLSINITPSINADLDLKATNDMSGMAKAIKIDNIGLLNRAIIAPLILP
jgi:hypothetical protein